MQVQKMMRKTYTDCIKLKTFLERYNYLKLNGKVGEETFGYNRYLNQILYKSKEWTNLRKYIIERDKACDLACNGFEIYSGRSILIHHLNPITLKGIYDRDPAIFDPENLICVTHRTHNAIHYGDSTMLDIPLPSRSKNDTCPWKV